MNTSTTYWVVRFVPDVVRGEFHNVGLIATDGSTWDARFDWWYLDNRTSRGMRDWARWFQGELQSRDMLFRDHEFTGAWVEGIRERQANTVQLSPPRMAVARNAADAIEVLFPRMVDHGHKAVERRRTRRNVAAEIRTLYNLNGFHEGQDFLVRPRIRMGETKGDFDFLETSDDHSLLRTAWGFDARDAEAVGVKIQAWNYGVARLRRDGATLVREGGSRPISQDTPIGVVIDPPRHSGAANAEVYETALEAWKREGVEVVTIDQFENSLIAA